LFPKNLILFEIFLSLFFICILITIKNTNTSNFSLRKILVKYGKYSYTAYLSHFLIVNCVKYFILNKYLYALNVYFALIVFTLIVLVITYIFSSILSNIIEKRFIVLGIHIIKYFKLNYQIK
jgi:peptidoglycan/LPS O-acetylase OafA/YrhL